MKNGRFWSRIAGAVTVLAVLAGCGGNQPAQAPTTAPAAQATTPPAAPTAAPAAATTAPAAAATTAPAAAATTAPAPSGQAGGTLRILYWQGPTVLNPHQGQGTKDSDAATVILESLAATDEKGELVPFLATEIPTEANGGIPADHSSITWKLKEGVKWSDGSPFTADDVVFTWQYCADAGTACTTQSNFEPIKNVEAVNPTTVKVNWKEPNPNPYVSFVGIAGRILQKAQFANCIGKKTGGDPACDAANNAPIGTGPFKLKEFKPGDTVIYERNPNFRDADKVFFDTVEIKGGGDASSAARAVCETGEVDYAWNLQVQKAVIDQISQGGMCDLIPNAPGSVERIVVNFADADPALGDARSEPGKPHPILSDLAVRQAISLAIDRKAIAEQVYGIAGSPTCNILTVPESVKSPNTKCDLNVEQANKLLDDAGWKLSADGSVREKDGKKLVLSYQTTINPVRQNTQAIVKANLNKIGVQTQMRAIDSTVFFSTDPANPDTFGKFYADLQMYTNNPDSPDPTKYLADFTCAQVASKENNWQLSNNGRFCSEEYDAVIAELTKEFDPVKRVELAIKANDILVNEGAVIPLIDRVTPEGKSKELKGPVGTIFDSVLWNIATWSK